LYLPQRLFHSAVGAGSTNFSGAAPVVVGIPPSPQHPLLQAVQLEQPLSNPQPHSITGPLIIPQLGSI
jgi:hypothetical protein